MKVFVPCDVTEEEVIKQYRAQRVKVYEAIDYLLRYNDRNLPLIDPDDVERLYRELGTYIELYKLGAAFMHARLNDELNELIAALRKDKERQSL